MMEARFYVRYRKLDWKREWCVVDRRTRKPATKWWSRRRVASRMCEKFNADYWRYMEAMAESAQCLT